ncbi:hypothetical protein CUC08_Gglean009544 [Alternaria sp. MG1]|jgi:hypothetical protein|nr:hypothetical protein CUC08_Gglean009544 [Alternaria sp. MG1]
MHQGHIPEVNIDRLTCFDRPFLESCSASKKEFDTDHRGDRHASAHGIYGDVAVRPVLGTPAVGLVLIGAILLSALLDMQALITVLVPVEIAYAVRWLSS